MNIGKYILWHGQPYSIINYDVHKDMYEVADRTHQPSGWIPEEMISVVEPPEGYKLTGEYRKPNVKEPHLDKGQAYLYCGSTVNIIDKYWILEKEEKMAAIKSEVKVDISTENVQTLVDSIAELQNRLDRVENGESAVKKSLLKKAIYFPIKIMIGRMVLTTVLAASAIGYTYYKGGEWGISHVSQEVISYIPSKKLLKVLDNGETVEYTLTDNGWMSLPDFKTVDTVFLERVANQILIEGIGQKSLPVEKKVLFWSWIE